MTNASNCMIIDELMNGKTPSANIVAFAIEPPDRIFRSPRKSEFCSVNACVNAVASNVGTGI